MKVILLFLVFFSLNSYAQVFLPVQFDSNRYSHELIVTGLGEFSSSSIRNELSHKFFLGGTITEEIKDRTFSHHTAVNRFGIDLNSEIEYRNLKRCLFDQDKMGFLLKGGYYTLGSVAYSKDAFGLTLYGNSDYAGQTATLSGSNAAYIRFQKIGFGIVDKDTKSNASINFYNVEDYFRGYLRKGELKQSADGTEIELALKGVVNTTHGNAFTKGVGLGVDFDYRIPLDFGREKKAVIQFIGRNIGFVHYFTGIQTYQLDSAYQYSGFKINQLYGDQTILNDNFSLYDTLGIQKTENKRTLSLPGFYQVGKIVSDNFSGKWQSFFGVRLYPALAFSPQAFAGAHLKVNSSIALGAQTSYGGFTHFRLGFYANAVYKNFVFALASQDLLGVFSKYGTGQSLLFRVRCKL
jgi:hypothetical protein